MTSKHPGQHSGDLFRRGRVDPCGGWFGWWYWRFLDESLGIFTECLIKRDLAGHMNGVDLAIMHLVGGHQTDPGMVMVLVVPVEELAAEASGVLDTAEASWEARLILQGLEVAFRERVVVGRVRAVMRPGDAEVSEQERGGFRLHWAGEHSKSWGAGRCRLGSRLTGRGWVWCRSWCGG